MDLHSLRSKIIFLTIDLFFLFTLLLLSFYIQYKYTYGIELVNIKTILSNHYKALILFIVGWGVIADYNSYYNVNLVSFYKNGLKRIFFQILLFGSYIFLISSLKSVELFSENVIILFCSIFLIAEYLIRYIYFSCAKTRLKKGLGYRNVLVLGKNDGAEYLINEIREHYIYGYKIIHIDYEFNESNFSSILEQNNIYKLFLDKNFIYDQPDFYKRLMIFCEDMHIDINFYSPVLERNIEHLEISYIGNVPILTYKKSPLASTKNSIIKRLIDIFISLFVCIFIMSWLFPLLAILIKIDSKGPVIFKQKRTGVNGESFDCYKFRTMKSDGTNSIQATVINDNRITKLGNLLRKTSLDEFPQFFNVLKGYMSIIGPRPHMLTVDKHYSNVVNRYYFRYYVKPGITGLSQVNGYRGDMTDENMNDRIKTDIFYIKNWSIILDIKILLKTFSLIFKGDKNAI